VEVIGLTLRDRVTLNRDVELAFMYAPGQETVEVELIYRGETGPTDGIVNHLAFTVDDIEEEISRLLSLGTKIIDKTPRALSALGGTKISFFEGPDGEILELMEK
jgi:lactoylglutathione lyase